MKYVHSYFKDKFILYILKNKFLVIHILSHLIINIFKIKIRIYLNLENEITVEILYKRFVR